MKCLFVATVFLLAGAFTVHAGASAAASGPATFIPTGTLLWRIGTLDNLASEFADFHHGPETVEIPAAGAVIDGAACAKISRGVRASANPNFAVYFPLVDVPPHGAFFTFKLLKAPKSGAQMAVFANGSFAGLIQLWGTDGTDCPYQWWKTYRLYIPKEFLKPGRNELRFTATHALWGNASNDDQQWWEWDYLKLETLDAPIAEAWHGKISYLGTAMTMGMKNWTMVDDTTLRVAPVALKWLGIAYSGNTMRTLYWNTSVKKQPKRTEFLQLLASYNMTAMTDFISGGTFINDPDGQIPQKMKDELKDFFQSYGKYIQYYELGNEPCLSGTPQGGYAEYLALAKEINALKPPHIKLVAPGWAYNGIKGGPPPGWDSLIDYRRNIEQLCDCINGHSYRYSYAENLHGSFLSELEDFGKQLDDGWPKEYLNSETGTHRHDSEENADTTAHQASTQPHIQVFDRILRAHLAVVDHTMQHAAIWGDFGLFAEPASWDDFDVNKLTINTAPDGVGNDTRAKTYRRLALAYATHGSPLAYTILNQSDLRYKLVYFRAVDTSTLAPQIASGATANKILLNFVNFENAPETLAVRVVLPMKAACQAERIGAGDTWGAAHSTMTLTGAPELELRETLGPGEAAQYILSRGQ